jgi:hypothetical protein
MEQRQGTGTNWRNEMRGRLELGETERDRLKPMKVALQLLDFYNSSTAGTNTVHIALGALAKKNT